MDDNEILNLVARTGSTHINTTWSNVKMILSQKIKNIEKDFFDPAIAIEDIPQYPNVDNFNFERLKSSLLDRLELFVAPPFTVQRMCELLVDPKKQYSRIDKFLRALEKNILVVSTVSGADNNGRRQSESDLRDSFELSNGTDSVEVSIEVKENEEQSGGETSGETENISQDSPKEISFHRLDDDIDEAPSPKKMRLNSDIPDDDGEHIDVDKSLNEGNPSEIVKQLEETTAEKSQDEGEDLKDDASASEMITDSVETNDGSKDDAPVLGPQNPETEIKEVVDKNIEEKMEESNNTNLIENEDSSNSSEQQQNIVQENVEKDLEADATANIADVGENNELKVEEKTVDDEQSKNSSQE